MLLGLLHHASEFDLLGIIKNLYLSLLYYYFFPLFLIIFVSASSLMPQWVVPPIHFLLLNLSLAIMILISNPSYYLLQYAKHKRKYWCSFQSITSLFKYDHTTKIRHGISTLKLHDGQSSSYRMTHY